jgi:hypothetical protein
VLGRTIILFGLLAMLLAPFGVIKTHGPAEIVAAAAHADHGHRLDPGMAASTPVEYQHNAADHEHQLQAVLTREDSEAFETTGLLFRPAMQVGSALHPEGLKRPPKQFTA